MPESITYRGANLWIEPTNGAGYSMSPGASVREVIEAASPLGTGYWIKLGNQSIARHTLSLQWHTTDPLGLRNSIESWADGNLGTLVVPGWGSFSNCRLESVSGWTSSKTDDVNGYIVEASLTFAQYP